MTKLQITIETPTRALLNTCGSLDDAVRIWTEENYAQAQPRPRVYIIELGSLHAVTVDTTKPPWSPPAAEYPRLRPEQRANFGALIHGGSEEVCLIAGTFDNQDAAYICVLHWPHGKDDPQGRFQPIPLAVFLETSMLHLMGGLNLTGDPDAPEDKNASTAHKPDMTSTPIATGTVLDIRNTLAAKRGPKQ